MPSIICTHFVNICTFIARGGWQLRRHNVLEGVQIARHWKVRRLENTGIERGQSYDTCNDNSNE